MSYYQKDPKLDAILFIACCMLSFLAGVALFKLTH